MPKSVHSFRLDDELVNHAKKANINIRALIEDSLARVARVRKCPTCRQEIKKGKK